MLGSKPVITKEFVQLMAAWQLAAYKLKQLYEWYEKGWLNKTEWKKAVAIRLKNLENDSKRFSAEASIAIMIDEQEL